MDDVFAMAVIKSISECLDDLGDLSFSDAPLSILWVAELAALHVFHDNVEVFRVVVNFIDFDDVGVFKLIIKRGT